MASAARRAAWDVLCAWLAAGPARARLGSRAKPFPPAELTARDRAFAKTLAEGTVKRLRTVDAVLARIAQRGELRPVGLRAALLLGAWQLLYDTRPAHSVVHESVGLARIAAKEGGARFANAVLRKLAAEPRPEAWLDPAGVGVWYSLPDLLVERWLAEHGEAGARPLFEASNAEPWLTLRVNAIRIDRDALAARLAHEGVVAHSGPHPLSLVVDRAATRAAPLETPAFEAGLFAVQDASQTEVVDMLDLAPGQRVLDYCAAPGGKSTAIAEATSDTGVVVAHDTEAARLERLPAEAARLGLASIRVVAPDALPAEPPFDRVLVDAPCSNTGVLARRAEARWRFDAGRLSSLAATQRTILDRALEHLRPGGRLVYSTCSIEADENEALARDFVARHGNVRLVSAERVLPELLVRDGCGVAVFVRTE